MKIINKLRLVSFCISIILLSTEISLSQPIFKEVKSADDVIKNYITAIGGESKLKKIQSYRISGLANLFVYKVNYDEYADSKIYYLNIGNDTIKVIKIAINDTTRWGMTDENGKDTVTDFSGPHHANWNRYLLKYNPIYFFLNYQKYGLVLKLDSLNKSNDITTYEITFSKSDIIRCIADFDKNNFYLKKFTVKTIYEEIFGSNQLDYKFDDYNVVDNTGIIMPFNIVRNDMFYIEISNYSFNEKIQEKLIQKPILVK